MPGEQVALAFIPLFVAFDVIGVLPVYWSLSQGMPAGERRTAVDKAIMVGFVVALVFMLVSDYLLRLMGLEMSDIMIAGGLILFSLAISDVLNPEKRQTVGAEALGVVPLGVPLIVGPAVLTALLLVRRQYGLWPTLGALSLNVLVTWGALLVSDWLMDRVGRDVAKVISKVSSLLLASFAVMLVRQGLVIWNPLGR